MCTSAQPDTSGPQPHVGLTHTHKTSFQAHLGFKSSEEGMPTCHAQALFGGEEWRLVHNTQHVVPVATCIKDLHRAYKCALLVCMCMRVCVCVCACVLVSIKLCQQMHTEDTTATEVS